MLVTYLDPLGYPFSFERVVSVMEVGCFMLAFIVLSSIHGLRVLPHVGYIRTVSPKGMPFNNGRIGKIVGLGINFYFKKNLNKTRNPSVAIFTLPVWKCPCQ